jgi:hypothetical protein
MVLATLLEFSIKSSDIQKKRKKIDILYKRKFFEIWQIENLKIFVVSACFNKM